MILYLKIRSHVGIRPCVWRVVGKKVIAFAWHRLIRRPQVVDFPHVDAVEGCHQPERLLVLGRPGDHRLVGQRTLYPDQERALHLQCRWHRRDAVLGRVNARFV